MTGRSTTWIEATASLLEDVPSLAVTRIVWKFTPGFPFVLS